jgi:D-alanyl-D-alanine carboxypeptidase
MAGRIQYGSSWGWRRTAASIAVTVVALAGTAMPARAGGTSALPRHELQGLLDEMVAAGVPGAIGTVRHDGRIWDGASGLGTVDPARRMRPEDRFTVGSVTKTFVATVVLQLVGERRLALGDSVERRLPGLVPHGADITIRQLLNHTSGLFDYTLDPRTFAPYFGGDFGFVWQPRQLIAIAVEHPPQFAPGTRHEYSNTGYILLGLIIEAVTGTGLRHQLQTRLLWPLGLHGTTFPLSEVRIRGPHSHAYKAGAGPGGGLLDVTAVSRTWAWAAGAMISTTQDLARFYRALLHGRLLTPSLLRQMRTTVPIEPGFRYGLGIAEIDLPCGTVIGHDGSDAGTQTWVLVTSDLRDEVVMMVNVQDDDTVQQMVLEHVARAFCALRPA